MRRKYGTILTVIISVMLAAFLLFACAGAEEQKPSVTPPPSGEISITLTQESVGMVMGQQVTVIANVENYDGVPTWMSSDESVATVSGGRITAVADGTAVITATVGGKTATVTVTVSSQENIVLNRESAKVFRGETVKLTATVRKGLTTVDSAVEWTSSDTDIATVDENGVVTGVKVSKDPVTITATSAGGKTATCEITVAQVVTLRLSQSELTLHPNSSTENSAELTATGKLGSLSLNASSINWSSSDPDIVNVTVNNGKTIVTAKKSGTAVITAQINGSDETAVCLVDSWYAVSTPADMEYMRNDINGTFKLVNDIDFNGAMWDGVTKWAGDNVPDSAYFGGVLDGQGFAIRNVNILSGWNNAIIGQTAPSSVVRNCSFVNIINQDTSNKVGAIVSFNKGLIENCYVECEIRSDSQSNWNSHGGIVATNAQTGIIRNCIVKVSASRTFKNTGAIVGYNCGAVEDCYAICPDAMLPMYYEWQSSLGYFKNCGVFTDSQKLASSAELYRFSDKIWTVTGCDVPALYNFPQVSFAAPVTYLSQGNTYTISPSNIKGVPIDWTVDGNDGQLVVTQNADYSLTISASRKGEVTLSARIYNGSTATTTVVVTGTVLSPVKENIALDYNNPSRSDTEKIGLVTDTGETVDSGATFASTDTSVATVDQYGVITAVGKGKCGITVTFNGDEYVELVKVDVTGWVQINTPEQFQAMATGLDLNYCLVGDIDFEEETIATITPYGNSEDDRDYFNGRFDGNGFTVKNVTVVGNDRGIWGRTATTAIIENTVFDNIIFRPASGKTEQNTFGVVSFNTGIIQNCVVHAVAYAGHSTDSRTGGAICGTNEFRGRVYNCIAYMDASNVNSGFMSTIMGLCQGVAKDCIGVVVGNTSASINAISYINSSSVSNCRQFTSESAAANACAPFGTFDRTVWEVGSGLPTLKKLVASETL